MPQEIEVEKTEVEIKVRRDLLIEVDPVEHVYGLEVEVVAEGL